MWAKWQVEIIPLPVQNIPPDFSQSVQRDDSDCVGHVGCHNSASSTSWCDSQLSLTWRDGDKPRSAGMWSSDVCVLLRNQTWITLQCGGFFVFYDPDQKQKHKNELWISRLSCSSLNICFIDTCRCVFSSFVPAVICVNRLDIDVYFLFSFFSAGV